VTTAAVVVARKGARSVHVPFIGHQTSHLCGGLGLVTERVTEPERPVLWLEPRRPRLATRETGSRCLEGVGSTGSQRAPAADPAPVIDMGVYMDVRFDSLRFALMASAALLGAGACTGTADDETPAALDENRTEAVESTSQALVLWSDPELAAFFLAVNNGEILQAQLAITKAVDPSVIEFAQTMIAHYTLANERLAEVLAQLGIAPLENPLSAALTRQAAAQVAIFEGLTGPGFDRAYIEVQIEAHRQVLAQLQTQLSMVGVGWEPGVPQLLPEFRLVVAQHLAFARAIGGFLGGYYPVHRW
jgi:putative membrane protein